MKQLSVHTVMQRARELESYLPQSPTLSHYDEWRSDRCVRALRILEPAQKLIDQGKAKPSKSFPDGYKEHIAVINHIWVDLNC